jgi:predicted enzyme related to lactoylglutathione lyase
VTAVADISLSLLVLKTHQLDKARSFYHALGVEFAEEKHGAGPAQYAGKLGGVVFELYPLPDGAGPADAATRLGFAVSDVDAAVQSVQAVGASVDRLPEETPWGRRAVVRDPDGRTVELYRR